MLYYQYFSNAGLNMHLYMYYSVWPFHRCSDFWWWNTYEMDNWKEQFVRKFNTTPETDHLKRKTIFQASFFNKLLLMFRGASSFFSIPRSQRHGLNLIFHVKTGLPGWGNFGLLGFHSDRQLQPSISQTSNYSPVGLGHVTRENPYHSPLIAGIETLFWNDLCCSCFFFFRCFRFHTSQNLTFLGAKKRWNVFVVLTFGVRYLPVERGFAGCHTG